MKKMEIRDFIKMEIDIDVCDDYDESVYIAFCGPVELTEAGEKEFDDVLKMKVCAPDMTCGVVNDIYNCAILPCENDNQADRLRKFFNSAAGWCSESNYDKWFK